MRSRVTACTLLIVLTMIASTASAAVPSLVNYSGVLTNLGGTPLTGTFSVVFKIYGSEVSTFPLWVETQSVTTDATGKFNILLGSVSALDENAFDGANTWLGIKVDSDPEMTPRTRIATVPYAFHLGTVDGATGGRIVGSLASGHNQTLAGVGNSNFLAGDSNTASGYASSVAAGIENTASGSQSLVGCGYLNQATGSNCFVGGGNQNTAEGSSSVVGGGTSNTAGSTASSNNYATVPGGYANTASGEASFAAGRRAWATNDYSFVWNGDASNVLGDTTSSNSSSSFVARAPGGVQFYSASKSVNSSVGVRLSTGSGSWAAMSDRNVKSDFREVDGDDLLLRLSEIPVTSWRYNSQDSAIRHIGPMAQDFYAAFGVGEDDKHITTIDADGVALAAIQALHQKNQALEATVADLQAQIRQIQEALASTPK